MNMNKVKDFTKKYGFYLAVGVISVGAITAVIVTSVNERNAGNQYVQEEGTDGRVVDEIDPTEVVPVGGMYEDQDMLSVDEVEGDVVTEVPSTSTSESKVTVDVDEITSETFNSTTVQGQETPFFAEGDTLLLPVEGKLVVPYTDDTTKHWYSNALEQTMRTYGVTVSAKQGESIKAPATAKVIDIVADSTTLDSTKYVGKVGKVIVMDLGNGYVCKVGVQGGEVDADLLGQVVLAGQEIGTAGEGTGPFAGAEGSVYIQLQHDGKTVDPTEMFAFNE